MEPTNSTIQPAQACKLADPVAMKANMANDITAITEGSPAYKLAGDQQRLATKTGHSGSAQHDLPRFLRDGIIPGEIGVWIFIFGDMLLFTVLFCSFMAERINNAEDYNRFSSVLHINLGGINTLLLLSSSVFVALGVRSTRERLLPQLAPKFFFLAILCGFGFIIIKYIEYSDLLNQDITPLTNVFYTYYYLLTGLHLFHLTIGMLVLYYLWTVAKIRVRDAEKHLVGTENGASYWHVVDLLWIVLFPLLYLVR